MKHGFMSMSPVLVCGPGLPASWHSTWCPWTPPRSPCLWYFRPIPPYQLWDLSPSPMWALRYQPYWFTSTPTRHRHRVVLFKMLIDFLKYTKCWKSILHYNKIISPPYYNKIITPLYYNRIWEGVRLKKWFMYILPPPFSSNISQSSVFLLFFLRISFSSPFSLRHLLHLHQKWCHPWPSLCYHGWTDQISISKKYLGRCR